MRGRLAGIFLTAMALPVCAAAIPANTQGRDPPAALLSLSVDPKAVDPSYVQTRCRDLVTASIVVGMILRSNPVTGRNEKSGKAMQWALMVDKDASFPLAFPESEANFTAAYLHEFGAVNVDQPEPQAAIYALDKAFCEPQFEFYE